MSIVQNGENSEWNEQEIQPDFEEDWLFFNVAYLVAVNWPYFITSNVFEHLFNYCLSFIQLFVLRWPILLYHECRVWFHQKSDVK